MAFEEYARVHVYRSGSGGQTKTFPGSGTSAEANKFIQPGDRLEFERADGSRQFGNVVPPRSPEFGPWEVILEPPDSGAILDDPRELGYGGGLRW